MNAILMKAYQDRSKYQAAAVHAVFRYQQHNNKQQRSRGLHDQGQVFLVYFDYILRYVYLKRRWHVTFCRPT